ncbi:glycosyltransferase [Halomonadaceae bacterium KBTZ08]
MSVTHHSVIVATHRRSELLKRALHSIASQSLLPDRVVIVDDTPRPETDLNGLRDLGEHFGLTLEVLANRRTAGASGAWNTALDHLQRNDPTPHEHLVSILDDDDWWEADYLQSVSTTAEKGYEVVAGTLTRLDGATPSGRRIAPPSELDASAFLKGNPGIQGSNLSARLSTFLEAGLFDEALSSCTDRDLCIRLADIRPEFCALSEAVANHDTLHDQPRLSDKDNKAKQQGLDIFHAKWRRRMTEEQYEASVARAHELFNWSPSGYLHQTTSQSTTITHTTSGEPLSLVVGVIVDGHKPQRCQPLLEGLAAFAKKEKVQAIDVVLLENGDPRGFQDIVKHAESLALNVWPVDINAQHSVNSDLSLEATDITHRKPIAIARTLLQRFVFEVSASCHFAPAWILDDDFRLPSEMDGLIRTMIHCRDSDIDVALGGNSGAAPVPASSLLRTQLLDTVHFLQSATVADPTGDVPHADTANARWIEDRQDYHYDLTRNGTDRLETPFLPCFENSQIKDAVGELLRKAERVLAGEAISRPVLPPSSCLPEEAQESCFRGGNTLVFDTTLLRDIPNTAPRVKGRPVRRSDMIWAANARFLFGKSVKSVSLPMTHDRSMERSDEDDSQRLVDDIVGYGFFRAYEEIIGQRTATSSSHAFNDNERHQVIRLTNKLALERLAAYQLSFWRSRGLARVLSHLIADEPWWITQASEGDHAAFLNFHRLLNETTELAHLKDIEAGVTTALQAGTFNAFLSEIEGSCLKPSTLNTQSFRPWVEQQRAEKARRLLQKHLKTTADTLLGMGAEGVVLRFGNRVVKVFDQWTARQRQSAAPVLTSLIEKPAGSALPQVLEVHNWSEAFAVEYRFEDSTPYQGGSGPEMVAMLQDLRLSGWVHRNISPKNLRITANGVQLVDIGKSLDPATPDGEEWMLRRAFLSWRFHHRADLAQLSRASLHSELLPELTGWRVLPELLRTASSKDRLDHHLRQRIQDLRPETVLDYGCGKPRDVSRLAHLYDLTAYDIDSGLRERWFQQAPEVPFWDEQALETALSCGETFDLIICSLVLCAVEDETMTAILGKLGKLVNDQGRLLIAVCDPAALKVTAAADQTRHDTEGLDPLLPASYSKTVKGSKQAREEHHRSIQAYHRAFARAGMRVHQENTVSGFDTEHIERVPEFLVFELEPLPEVTSKTSLLIKLCALEAETALYQVRHLERQLGRPRAFDETVLLLDPTEGPFHRAHCSGNLNQLREATERLLAEGVVDVVVDGLTDGAEAAEHAYKWTGHSAHHAHCANGQPATSILKAFEACSGDYILHADADVLVGRPEPSLDHIADALKVFDQNTDAVTLALPVYGDTDSHPRSSYSSGYPFRTEAMVGWISRSRLMALRPLPGEAISGRLELPWHRMLDIAVRQNHRQSLRCGSSALWFVAPDNARKISVDDHLLFIDHIERNQTPDLQKGYPLIQGVLGDWLGPKRREAMVLIICGRNVRSGAIDRCLSSLTAQSYQHWGAIVIDDASDNGSEEVISRACRDMGERVTLVRRQRRVGLMANTFLAVRELITSRNSIVVLLDLDDALADPGALAKVARRYEEGADLTVGSMVRTDKNTNYPVNFSNPRDNRGGNVWQHLRTFRKSLFDRIAPEDLKLEGRWIDLATDWAYMLPMVEMASNPTSISDVVYLHQPSTARPPEEKAARERTIRKIINKSPYAQHTTSPQVTVLCYHRILEQIPDKGPEAMFHKRGMAVTAATFESQLRDALKHFEPIRAVDLLAAQREEKALPSNALLVTVDDGYRDFMTVAKPILTKMGIEPIIFVRAPTSDGYPSWAPLDMLYAGRAAAGMETPIPSPQWREHTLNLPIEQQKLEVLNHIGQTSYEHLAQAREELYLSGSEIRSLSGVAVGGHGHEHVRWTHLDDQELDRQLNLTRAWLEEIDGLPIAAYPDGQYDKRVANRLADCGYTSAFALNEGSDSIDAAFSVRRIVMPDDPSYVKTLIESKQESLLCHAAL